MTATKETTIPVDARRLSCQALAAIDPDQPTFHGQPVAGYIDEMSRRGEGHIHSWVDVLNPQMTAALEAYDVAMKAPNATLEIVDPGSVDVRQHRLNRYRHGGKPTILADLAALSAWRTALDTLHAAIQAHDAQLNVPPAGDYFRHPDVIASNAAQRYLDGAEDDYGQWRRLIHDTALMALVYPDNFQAEEA